MVWLGGSGEKEVLTTEDSEYTKGILFEQKVTEETEAEFFTTDYTDYHGWDLNHKGTETQRFWVWRV
jgi:hypothetical protein